MTSKRIAALVVCCALASGCGASYFYGQTAETMAPAKPADCTFHFLAAAPSRPFEELGIIATDDIMDGHTSGGETPFREAMGDQICRAGGDAVVVEKDYRGNILRGTVIRYK